MKEKRGIKKLSCQNRRKIKKATGWGARLGVWQKKLVCQDNALYRHRMQKRGGGGAGGGRAQKTSALYQRPTSLVQVNKKDWRGKAP